MAAPITCAAIAKSLPEWALVAAEESIGLKDVAWIVIQEHGKPQNYYSLGYADEQGKVQRAVHFHTAQTMAEVNTQLGPAVYAQQDTVNFTAMSIQQSPTLPGRTNNPYSAHHAAQHAGAIQQAFSTLPSLAAPKGGNWFLANHNTQPALPNNQLVTPNPVFQAPVPPASTVLNASPVNHQAIPSGPLTAAEPQAQDHTLVSDQPNIEQDDEMAHQFGAAEQLVDILAPAGPQASTSSQ